MCCDGYEIKDYNPAYVAEVSELQKYLYDISKDITVKYFQWKYEQNPHSFVKKPLGKIAVHNGKIVGFRGFFSTKWCLGSEDNNIFMLSSSDVCVHPEHRKKGLFQKMTEEAIKDYADYGHKFYINLSSNQFSTPGDIKMAWKEIAVRKIVRRCGILALLKYFIVVKGRFRFNCFNAKYGRFENIEVSDIPNKEAMHSVSKRQTGRVPPIRFSRDVNFLKWKYQNNLRKYIFLYHWDRNNIDGYVVLGIRRYTPQYTNKADIIDFSQSNNKALEEILKYILSMFSTNIFDVWNFNIDPATVSIFNHFGFSENSYTARKQEIHQGKRCCLIRPVNENYAENDWFVNGVDLRMPENLEIKEISADDS